MVRKSVPIEHRGFSALLGAGGLGVLVVATVAACASTSGTNGAGGAASASVPVAASSSVAPPASASSSGATAGTSSTATASSTGNHPLIPATGGVVASPKAQVTKIPAGGKLTAFDSAARSEDGMTLYVGIESQGGACGQYDVVLEQTSTTVSVGLVHLPSGGRVCPMYVTRMLVPAKLSSPLDGRTVVDLENGQVVQAPVRS